MLLKDHIQNIKNYIESHKEWIKKNEEYEGQYEEDELAEKVLDDYNEFYFEDAKGFICDLLSKVLKNERLLKVFEEEEENTIYNINDELSYELEEEFLRTDENIFDDELDKVMFRIIIEQIKFSRKNRKDIKKGDVSNFDLDLMDEFFYLAIKDSPIRKLISKFDEDRADDKYGNYITYRRHFNATWEEFL